MSQHALHVPGAMVNNAHLRKELTEDQRAPFGTSIPHIKVGIPQAFETQWLSPKSEKQSPTDDIGQGRAEGVNILRGVPIAGAYADKATAALNAAASPYISTSGMSNAPTFGERMSENEKRIKAGTDKYNEEHPVASGIEQFAGGTAAMAPVAATAVGARALGLTGGLVQRAFTGAVTNGAISGADSTARSGGDTGQAGLGAAVGAGIRQEYNKLYKYLASSHLLKADHDRFDHEGPVAKYLLQEARSLAGSMRLTEINLIYRLTDKNGLALAKIVLSHFRRLERYYLFFAEGRVQEP